MNTKYSVFFLTLLLIASWTATAEPPHTATLDGRPLEYDGVELRGTNDEPPHFGDNNVITNLYVTWDTNYLYVMLQGWESDNKLVVLMDVDPDSAPTTGTTTTTNWTGTGEGFIDYNDVGWVKGGGQLFNMDYMIASDGDNGNFLRVLYDGVVTPTSSNVINVLDQFNNIDLTGGGVDMANLSDTTDCPLKGFEIRIPWIELYTTNDNRFGAPGPGGVPTNAHLHVFANLHNNSNTSVYSSSNAIPPWARSDWTNGVLTTDNHIEVVLDGNGDGVPDMASGDVNAPWINDVTGAEGAGTMFVSFNEAVTPATASNAANYEVSGFTPNAVTVVSPTLVQLDLSVALPAEDTLVLVQSIGVEDAAANSKTSTYCLVVGPAGIGSPVTVTFVLNSSSGLGAGGAASAFFVNGGALPLQFGYPPATNTPLAASSGVYFTNDVTFPAGTPAQFGYKYSGILVATGTNNYEAVRPADYEDATRWLTLNDVGTPMVVTDYLGAAAHPLRQGGEGSFALYNDARRGDAGVRTRTTLTFQLDLSARNLAGVQRVIIQGSDPLRGFNSSWQSSTSNVPDFASGDAVGWLNGGLDLFDDGTHGDSVSGDSIYSRQWVWSIDGSDATAEPGAPNSLVGGSFVPPPGTLPYKGGSWINGRSPRSFIYRYYVVDAITNGLASPATDIEYYIHDADGTDIVIDPYVWENDTLPELSATNPATITDFWQTTTFTTNIVAGPPVSTNIVTNVTASVVYTNIALAADNAIEIAELPGATWRNFDMKGVGAGNVYTAEIANAGVTTEMYRVRTPGYPRMTTWWEPNPAPFGGTVDVFFTQNDRPLSGSPVVSLAGNINGWDGAQNPMTFLSNGLWTVSLDVPTNNVNDYNPVNGIYWKANDAPNTTTWDGRNPDTKDFAITHSNQGLSWSPNRAVPGQPLMVTYNAAGRALGGSTNMNLGIGYDSWDFTSWTGGGDPAMVSNAPNVWTYTIDVPSTVKATVHVEPHSGGTYDGNEGKNHTIFIEQP